LDNTHSLTVADIRWQTDGTPVSQYYGDIYFSRSHGLEESRHVFLAGNQLARRWQQLPKNAHFIIIETGFGTGLNFLAAWQLWRQTTCSDAQLHYIGIEKHPLPKPDISRALSQWPQLQHLASALIRDYPPPLPGIHPLAPDDRVRLSLGFGDIIDVLDDICDCDHPLLRQISSIAADAWFLDGFAPVKNPVMWSEAVIQRIAALSKPGTSFATFTAAGQVKRNLRAVGFTVRKTRGFGRKRDMLCGEINAGTRPGVALPAPRKITPAWHCGEYATYEQKSALVVGAGLAGCHTARALADSGWQVTVLEQAQHYALAASGNPSGILYTRLSASDSDQADFGLSAYLYACRHYRAYFDRQLLREDIDGRLNGMLQLGFNDTERSNIERIGRRYQGFDELVRTVSASEASALSGIEIEYPALFFAASGWLKPRRVCRQLLDHTSISLVEHCRITALNPRQSGWQLLAANGDCFEAPLCVVSCGIDSAAFAPLSELPIRSVGGQITLLPTGSDTPALSLCHSGYVAPDGTGGLCCGASFRVNDSNTDIRDQDHQHNLQQLANHVPALLDPSRLPQLAINQLEGRAAVRCTTPDYLPIVGPAPRLDAVRTTFRPLAANAKARIDLPGDYWPGLFVNTGHGSKGLASTPIAAACIAAQVNQSPRPLPWRLMRALSPTRFAIRSLIRSGS
jgi:tRNA 5-methylaminomethyl-2-thiouridine biosynthesis bifunctional protein